MEDRFKLEQQLIATYPLVVGVDEAGRGPLAGPVVAAAVFFPEQINDAWWEEIADCKKLSPRKRDSLVEKIQEYAQVGIGVGSIEQIESFNILRASLIAMRLAVTNLAKQNFDQAYILIDGLNRIPGLRAKQFPLVKGDAKVHSIAAASIVAKVARDKIMEDYHEQYPEYNFAQHKGYGTKQHREAILKYGLSPIHRQSFCRKIFA